MFVVKVAWEGPEKVKSTWEPVSRVFHDAPAVLWRESKALRLKMGQKRGGTDYVCDHIVAWGSRILISFLISFFV